MPAGQSSGLGGSLWSTVTAGRLNADLLAGDVRAEVVVIGAGFTGLSTALHLLELGRSVVILEAAEVGFGASGRNSGQVISTMSGIEPDRMAELYGEAGERFARLVGGSADQLFQLVARHAIACEANQSGWFQPAHSAGRLQHSAARVEAWARRGAPVQLLDARQASQLLGSKAWHGGMLNSSGGHINPLALARSLAELVIRKGGGLFERTPAGQIERTKGGWTVTTPAGRVFADQVMLATNAYSDQFAPQLAARMARALIPVVTWQMATEPQSEAVRATVVPGRQAVSDTRGDLRFFRWDARGRLITGGALIWQANAPARLRRLVGNRLAQAFPQMGTPRFDFVWSGRIGMTADRMPRFYQPAPGLWAWSACNGRGVALSISLGEQFAKAMTGTNVKELALPLTEITPYPLHSFATLAAPALLGLYRLRDRIEFRSSRP